MTVKKAAMRLVEEYRRFERVDATHDPVEFTLAMRSLSLRIVELEESLKEKMK